MISFMFKCPTVRISSSYLPAIKSSFQNAVRTVHVPSPMSIPISYVNPFSSYPFQSALTDKQLAPLPASVSSLWQILLTPARCQGQRCSSESQLCRETTNSSKIIGIQWHLCKMRKKKFCVNNRWSYFEPKRCALLRYYHHWIFYIARIMPCVCVGLPRSWQNTIPLQLHSYNFTLWVSLPSWPISLLPSAWTLYFSQIVLLIALNYFWLSFSPHLCPPTSFHLYLEYLSCSSLPM